tara:strand:+ start:1583 stop:2530 length:948 start_codon:yes stop_codon:yes gene_type:complete
MALSKPGMGEGVTTNFTGMGSAGGGGGGAVPNADWTRANIADGSWTLNDPDSTLSSISNTGGVNQVTVDTAYNPSTIDAGVHYKEILNEDGTSIDFGDRPVNVQIYLHWPSTGWSADGNTGGLNRPFAAGRSYTVAGVMTDPENLPSSPGETEFPRDILGYGLEWKNSETKTNRRGIWNLGTGAPRGALTLTSQNQNVASNADYLAGRKCVNRIMWWGRIAKLDSANTTGINVAGEPLMNEFTFSNHWDNGYKVTGDIETVVNQRFGRVRTNKLYVWVSNGRGMAAGGSSTIDFNLYYRITALDGGNHPSGRTGL